MAINNRRKEYLISKGRRDLNLYTQEEKKEFEENLKDTQLREDYIELIMQISRYNPNILDLFFKDIFDEKFALDNYSNYFKEFTSINGNFELLYGILAEKRPKLFLKKIKNLYSLKDLAINALNQDNDEGIISNSILLLLRFCKKDILIENNPIRNEILEKLLEFHIKYTNYFHFIAELSSILGKHEESINYYEKILNKPDSFKNQRFMKKNSKSKSNLITMFFDFALFDYLLKYIKCLKNYEESIILINSGERNKAITALENSYSYNEELIENLTNRIENNIIEFNYTAPFLEYFSLSIKKNFIEAVIHFYIGLNDVEEGFTNENVKLAQISFESARIILLNLLNKTLYLRNEQINLDSFLKIIEIIEFSFFLIFDTSSQENRKEIKELISIKYSEYKNGLIKDEFKSQLSFIEEISKNTLEEFKNKLLSSLKHIYIPMIFPEIPVFQWPLPLFEPYTEFLYDNLVIKIKDKEIFINEFPTRDNPIKMKLDEENEFNLNLDIYEFHNHFEYFEWVYQKFKTVPPKIDKYFNYPRFEIIPKKINYKIILNELDIQKDKNRKKYSISIHIDDLELSSEVLELLITPIIYYTPEFSVNLKEISVLINKEE